MEGRGGIDTEVGVQSSNFKVSPQKKNFKKHCVRICRNFEVCVCSSKSQKKEDRSNQRKVGKKEEKTLWEGGGWQDIERRSRGPKFELCCGERREGGIGFWRLLDLTLLSSGKRVDFRTDVPLNCFSSFFFFFFLFWAAGTKLFFRAGRGRQDQTLCGLWVVRIFLSGFRVSGVLGVFRTFRGSGVSGVSGRG